MKKSPNQDFPNLAPFCQSSTLFPTKYMFWSWNKLFVNLRHFPWQSWMLAGKSWTYTRGQRYGITTIKWHLREFDRYLLFLVVCSIAERNTVDLIDLLRNQIEWPNTVSIVWGPLRLKRRKSEFRGSHLKWSLPSHYHFDAFMQRGVSVKTIDISLNF